MPWPSGSHCSSLRSDAVAARVNPGGDGPEGMIFHNAGWDEECKVFRTFDLWATREDKKGCDTR